MLECKQLLSRNRERLPLHKFFPLLFQSIIRQLVFRSVSPPQPKNLGFIASYMLQFKPVFTRRKLWAYWLSSTFLPLSREELVLVTLTCQLSLLPWKDAIFRKRMLVERNGVQKAGLQCKRSRSRFAIQSHSYSIVEEWRQVKSNKKERTVALIPSSPFQTRSSYWIFQFISIGGEGGIILLSQPWEQFRTFQRSRIFRDKVGILNHACLNLHWLGMRTCPRLLQTCGGMFPVLCFGWTWLGFVDKFRSWTGMEYKVQVLDYVSVRFVLRDVIVWERFSVLPFSQVFFFFWCQLKLKRVVEVSKRIFKSFACFGLSQATFLDASTKNKTGAHNFNIEYSYDGCNKSGYLLCFAVKIAHCSLDVKIIIKFTF